MFDPITQYLTPIWATATKNGDNDPTQHYANSNDCAIGMAIFVVWHNVCSYSKVAFVTSGWVESPLYW